MLYLFARGKRLLVPVVKMADLYPIKTFIQHLKFQKVLNRYDDLYSMDMFGESTEGHKYGTPYQVVKKINPN